MFSTIVSGLRAWRVSLCGLVAAGLLLGVPITSNFPSQSSAWAKGGGHHSGGHKGSKGGKKRHGPKRHHAEHHLAKTHRHAKRREHYAHRSHADISHVASREFTNYHHGWDYYWGHHGYLDADVVETGVVAPVVTAPVVTAPVVTAPAVAGKKTYIVKLFAPRDRKNHIEEVVASTHEKVKERLLQKYADADFKSIQEKPAADGQDVYLVKFHTPGDQQDYAADILASTGDQAKAKVLEKHADASFKSVEVKPVIDAP